jgi:hypothetical protein
MADEIFAVGAGDAIAVTKSDATTYLPSNTGYLDALYVGGGGDVAVVTVAGSTVTFVGVLAGSIIPVQCRQVLNATTATNIVGLRF